MRRTSIGIGLLALLAAACGEAPAGPARPLPAPPRLAVVGDGNSALVERSRDEQHLSGIFQLCGSTEPVDLEATLVMREHFVFPASGGRRYTFQLVYRIRGTGVESGLRYVGQGTWTEVVIEPGADGGAATTRTWNARARVVRQGSADDLAGVIHVRQTINANGVVTSEFDIVEGECVGA